MNNEEFQKLLLDDLSKDNTELAKLISDKQIQGHHLPRIACEDDTFLLDLIGLKDSEINKETIHKFRATVAERIFFGDRRR